MNTNLPLTISDTEETNSKKTKKPAGKVSRKSCQKLVKPSAHESSLEVSSSSVPLSRLRDEAEERADNELSDSVALPERLGSRNCCLSFKIRRCSRGLYSRCNCRTSLRFHSSNESRLDHGGTGREHIKFHSKLTELNRPWP